MDKRPTSSSSVPLRHRDGRRRRRRDSKKKFAARSVVVVVHRARDRIHRATRRISPSRARTLAFGVLHSSIVDSFHLSFVRRRVRRAEVRGDDDARENNARVRSGLTHRHRSRRQGRHRRKSRNRDGATARARRRGGARAAFPGFGIVCEGFWRAARRRAGASRRGGVRISCLVLGAGRYLLKVYP